MGIAGFGAIGQAVATAFATEDGIPGLRLAAIGARDAAKVRAALPSGLPVPPEIVGITDLAPSSSSSAPPPYYCRQSPNRCCVPDAS